MRSFALIMLFAVSSCATPYREMDPNRDFWIGKKSDDLATHPAFASMPLESRKTDTGIETRTFRNHAGKHAKASCRNGIDCNSVEKFSSEIVCSHVFILKNDTIINYNRVGRCGPERIEFRPLDENGDVIMSQAEVDYLKTKGTSNCGILGRIIASNCK